MIYEYKINKYNEGIQYTIRPYQGVSKLSSGDLDILQWRRKISVWLADNQPTVTLYAQIDPLEMSKDDYKYFFENELKEACQRQIDLYHNQIRQRKEQIEKLSHCICSLTRT